MKEGADKMSEGEASEPLKVYIDAEMAAKAKLSATRTVLIERQQVSQDNAAHMETIKGLLARLTEAQADMTKTKAATGVHEQCSMAKRPLEELNEKIATPVGEVTKARDACAALLKHRGQEFLVQESIRTLATARAAHMKDKSLELGAIFKEVVGKANKEAAFVKYLAKMPEATGHEEIVFSDERRQAIFKQLDADKDGALSEVEFASIFSQHLVCKRGVTLKDAFAGWRIRMGPLMGPRWAQALAHNMLS
jgi:hypothetical protein